MEHSTPVVQICPWWITWSLACTCAADVPLLVLVSWAKRTVQSLAVSSFVGLVPWYQTRSARAEPPPTIQGKSLATPAVWSI